MEHTRLRFHYRALIDCPARPHEGYRPSPARIPAEDVDPGGTEPRYGLRYGSFHLRKAVMHYPRRVSKIKRIRKLGFRARMKTSLGRKMINRKRRLGRRIAAA